MGEKKREVEKVSTACHGGTDAYDVTVCKKCRVPIDCDDDPCNCMTDKPDYSKIAKRIYTQGIDTDMVLYGPEKAMQNLIEQALIDADRRGCERTKEKAVRIAEDFQEVLTVNKALVIAEAIRRMEAK